MRIRIYRRDFREIKHPHDRSSLAPAIMSGAALPGTNERNLFTIKTFSHIRRWIKHGDDVRVAVWIPEFGPWRVWMNRFREGVAALDLRSEELENEVGDDDTSSDFEKHFLTSAGLCFQNWSDAQPQK